MPKYSESADLRVGLTLAALAPDKASAAASDERPDALSVLRFEVGGDPFAVAVEHTEGVVDCPRIAPLPAPPEGFIGVASVRGRMTLVMDLSLGSSSKPERRRLILLKGEAQLGLLADRVEGVLALSPKSIRRRSGKRAPPNAKRDERAWPASLHFKEGKRLVPILDIDALTEL